MRQIDTISYANPLRPMSSMWKFGFAAVLLIFAYVAHPIIQGLVFLWMSIWILGYAKVSIKIYLLLLGAPFLFFLTSVPAIVLEWKAGPIPYAAESADSVEGWIVFTIFHGVIYLSQAGLLKAGFLLVRLAASLSCFYFLILTTPFSALLQVMQRLRMPHIVLELMLITYRFIFLLYDTAQGIRIAQRGRGGHVGFVRTLRDIAMLFTRLFSKTMERYRGLAQGLVSRGFDSQIHLAPYQSGSVGWRYGLESGIGIVLLLVMESLLYWKGG